MTFQAKLIFPGRDLQVLTTQAITAHLDAHRLPGFVTLMRVVAVDTFRMSDRLRTGSGQQLIRFMSAAFKDRIVHGILDPVDWITGSGNTHLKAIERVCVLLLY